MSLPHCAGFDSGAGRCGRHGRRAALDEILEQDRDQRRPASLVRGARCPHRASREMCHDRGRPKPSDRALTPRSPFARFPSHTIIHTPSTRRAPSTEPVRTPPRPRAALGAAARSVTPSDRPHGRPCSQSWSRVSHTLLHTTNDAMFINVKGKNDRRPNEAKAFESHNSTRRRMTVIHVTADTSRGSGNHIARQADGACAGYPICFRANAKDCQSADNRDERKHHE